MAPVNREEFLDRAGDPSLLLDEAWDLRDEANAIWDRIRNEFFTARGEPRKKAPDGGAVIDRRRMDNLRGRALELERKAAQANQMREDPWSHTRPDLLQEFGFPT